MKLNKAIVAGHIVISFDNVINGFLSVVIAPIFFGISSDPIVQLLLSYSAFAMMYVFQPLGAIVFGKLGDKIGRKKILLMGIFGIGLADLITGLLPTYQITVIAPIMLVLLRSIHGFFLGAEYSGVLIYNHETGNIHPSSASAIISCGIMGGAIAAIVCFFITKNGTPEWFWRLPYIVGGISALIILTMWQKMPETREYIKAFEERRIAESPIKKIMQNYKLEIATSIAISACYIGLSYSSTIFGSRLFQQAGYTAHESMIFIMINLFFSAVSIMIMGKIANIIGLKRLLKYGTLSLIAMAWPLCFLISSELTITKIYLYMAIITFLSSSVVSCSATYISNLFKVSYRYTGFAFAESMGSVIGGLTPCVMLLLSSFFKSNIGCVIWFYILTIPAFILIRLMNRTIDHQNR